ncbi:MAG: ComF family protein [Lachnospiraceae bacterium]|nr:ComF family protein [Lachnospiraceae bacterium]
MKKLADVAAALIYPPRCPLCDRILPFGEQICPCCREDIVYEREPRCMKCGRSIRREEGGADRVYCRDCEKHPHVYDFGYCLADYHSVARAIYRIKYRNRRESARWFGREIAGCLGKEITDLRPEVLVPVPLHRSRMRKRGYNQAADIALGISDRLGIPVRQDLVIRQKNTIPMKQSDNAQKRRNNVKNAFQLCTDDVKYKRIIIVDDIYTSGSTIDAVAAAFRGAGVAGIWFVAIAGTHL